MTIHPHVLAQQTEQSPVVPMAVAELAEFLDSLTVDESQHMLAFLEGAVPKEFRWAVERVRRDRVKIEESAHV